MTFYSEVIEFHYITSDWLNCINYVFLRLLNCHLIFEETFKTIIGYFRKAYQPNLVSTYEKFTVG